MKKKKEEKELPLVTSDILLKPVGEFSKEAFKDYGDYINMT